MTRRHAKHLNSASRILEVGCGVGANIPFLLSTGAQYFAVEGSETAAHTVRERFPQMASQITTGDFIANIPFDGAFDLIVDRAAMTHNDEASIRRGIGRLASKLKPGGLYIGIDWFSTSHTGFQSGVPAGDRWTRDHIESGPFAGVGRVHFSDETHLRELFEGWDWVALEEKVVRVLLPQPGVIASWHCVLKKR
ncbi:class I SAM-dependent methyltransferase [Paraburkholderia sp. GAS334]|uniref:class I SAM-dependent methyltransferase n=1 Tax=Paraburkholderia sp. GAS334 TaxID=3035131 RepID=UPI003D1A8297